MWVSGLRFRMRVSGFRFRGSRRTSRRRRRAQCRQGSRPATFKLHKLLHSGMTCSVVTRCYTATVNLACGAETLTIASSTQCPRKVDIRLPGKENSKSRGARRVY